MIKNNNLLDLPSQVCRVHFILTTTAGRSPLRTWKTTELFVSAGACAEQPQCVSCSKLNLRRRNRPHKNNPATEATIASETACCQFMLATYAQNRFAQPIFSVEFPRRAFTLRP